MLNSNFLPIITNFDKLIISRIIKIRSFFFFFKFINLKNIKKRHFFWRNNYMYSQIKHFKIKIFQKWLKYKKKKRYKMYNFFKFSITKYRRLFIPHYWFILNKYITTKYNYLCYINNTIKYKSFFGKYIQLQNSNNIKLVGNKLHTDSITKTINWIWEFYNNDELNNQNYSKITIDNNLISDKKIFITYATHFNGFYNKKYEIHSLRVDWVKKLKKWIKKRKAEKFFKKLKNNTKKNILLLKKIKIWRFYKFQLNLFRNKYFKLRFYINKNNLPKKINNKYTGLNYLTSRFLLTKNSDFSLKWKIINLKIIINNYNYKTYNWRIII